MVECKYSTVRERDMDLLFLELLATDAGFADLLVSRAELTGKPLVKSIELSRSDAELGESDITAVISINGEDYGFLIEDKVDAIAQPNQYERYKKRGEKGVKAGEFSEYRIFIFCPEKYLKENDEAKKYTYQLTYEETAAHLSKQDDLISSIRRQQIEQAIDKAKKPPVVNINEKVNSFFRSYRDYCIKNYPKLDLRTKETSNGWWAHYGLEFGKVYIYHKIKEGLVDMTFPNAADHINVLNAIVDWLDKHGIHGVTAKVTGGAGALRIHVPELDMEQPFEQISESKLDECFRAIVLFQELADFWANAMSVGKLK